MIIRPLELKKKVIDSKGYCIISNATIRQYLNTPNEYAKLVLFMQSHDLVIKPFCKELELKKFERV